MGRPRDLVYRLCALHPTAVNSLLYLVFRSNPLALQAGGKEQLIKHEFAMQHF